MVSKDELQTLVNATYEVATIPDSAITVEDKYRDRINAMIDAVEAIAQSHGLSPKICWRKHCRNIARNGIYCEACMDAMENSNVSEEQA